MADVLDRRALGAIRLVDGATGAPLDGGFRVRGERARFVRNRRGLYVVVEAAGLEALSASFRVPSSPPPPASVSIALTVTDASGRFLPRRATLVLPRDADPANRDSAGSLFRAVRLRLFAGRTRAVSTNASALRVTVTDGAARVRGAYLRLRRQGTDETLGAGITDGDGEGLVLLPRLPLLDFSDALAGPVRTAEVAATLEVSTVPDHGWPPDPDLLETDHAANLRRTLDLALRAGRTATAAIDLAG